VTELWLDFRRDIFPVIVSKIGCSFMLVQQCDAANQKLILRVLRKVRHGSQLAVFALEKMQLDLTL
jgi:hypothetical protein